MICITRRQFLTQLLSFFVTFQNPRYLDISPLKGNYKYTAWKFFFKTMAFPSKVDATEELKISQNHKTIQKKGKSQN